MKKILPILLAAVAFIVVLLILSPAPEESVLVAAYDLNTGHIMAEGDVMYATFPRKWCLRMPFMNRLRSWA